MDLALFGFLAASCAFSMVCTVFVWWHLSKYIKDVMGRLSVVEKWQSDFEASEAEAEKEEAQARHEDLSQRGQRGVQIREENKEMRQAALAEGRALMAGIGPGIITDSKAQGQAKAELVKLALKYPKVAEEVADRLIYEFKAEPYKDVIKGIIGQALHGQLAPSPQEAQAGSGAYF